MVRRYFTELASNDFENSRMNDYCSYSIAPLRSIQFVFALELKICQSLHNRVIDWKKGSTSSYISSYSTDTVVPDCFTAGMGEPGEMKTKVAHPPNLLAQKPFFEKLQHNDVRTAAAIDFSLMFEFSFFVAEILARE